MRAIILLVLLLAIIALFSYHEPLRPYWEERGPAVMKCLDEGRYRDAWAAATAADPPGSEPRYWQKSEPLGEPGPKTPHTEEAAAEPATEESNEPVWVTSDDIPESPGAAESPEPAPERGEATETR